MSNGGTTDPCEETHEGVITEAITTPRRVSVDGVDVSNRSAAELISLIRHQQTQCAARGGARGLNACTIQQAVPPSALGIHSRHYYNGGRFIRGG